MNRSRLFVCAEHEEFGSLGWRPLSMPHADPLGGMGVAHDLLEHSMRDNGSVAAEFKALGTALWLRGQGGFWQRNTYRSDPAENIAADIPDLLMHVECEGFEFGPPSRTRRVAEAYEQIEAVLNCAAKELRDRDSGWADRWRREWRFYAREWLHLGWARAAQTYRDHDPWSLTHEVFVPLMEQADKWLVAAHEGMVVRAWTDGHRWRLEDAWEL